MICPTCKTRFKPAVPWTKYCTRKCGNTARVRKHRKRNAKVGNSHLAKKLYKVVGRLSGDVYAKSKTVRGARAQRRRVARQRFITESLLDIVNPMGKVVL